MALSLMSAAPATGGMTCKAESAPQSGELGKPLRVRARGSPRPHPDSLQLKTGPSPQGHTQAFSEGEPGRPAEKRATQVERHTPCSLQALTRAGWRPQDRASGSECKKTPMPSTQGTQGTQVGPPPVPPDLLSEGWTATQATSHTAVKRPRPSPHLHGQLSPESSRGLKGGRPQN